MATTFPDRKTPGPQSGCTPFFLTGFHRPWTFLPIMAVGPVRIPFFVPLLSGIVFIRFPFHRQGGRSFDTDLSVGSACFARRLCCLYLILLRRQCVSICVCRFTRKIRKKFTEGDSYANSVSQSSKTADEGRPCGGSESAPETGAGNIQSGTIGVKICLSESV